ncbi:hypothetical protein Patl1_10248 [Pistacia atlantica]|uniref:Uncharacterized protein n=1 Tax=Pistacia atlantica TaxID=434234 RepID=A0ACC1A9B4_9ROSI|nr:hypothetical protein Patl1_10248 [Pistacia atlantica]
MSSSLPVPSVQKLAKEPLTFPSRYVRSDQDPTSTSNATSLPPLPTINLQKLLET